MKDDVFCNISICMFADDLDPARVTSICVGDLKPCLQFRKGDQWNAPANLTRQYGGWVVKMSRVGYEDLDDRMLELIAVIPSNYREALGYPDIDLRVRLGFWSRRFWSGDLVIGSAVVAAMAARNAELVLSYYELVDDEPAQVSR